ncbi:MAG: YihY family inner membrane protein [Phycisphaerae bacterium]|nr:YihY family inner membrane protein [Phycisphaerae bacterium]
MQAPAAHPNVKKEPSDARRYAREARRVHGADAWLMELLAPLHNVRLGRVSIGDAADIATFCLRHLREDRAPQIASALAFRTLFGLVPVLVVVTLIAKAALGESFLPTIERFFQSLGLNTVSISVAAGDGTTASSIGLDAWLMQLVGFANTLNIAALGFTGFLLVALSAIWILVTIEDAFNVIYRSQVGRSWMRRILVYWFVLTVGPLLLGALPWALAKFAWVDDVVKGWSILETILRVLGSVSVIWLVLLGAYLTIPTARVSFRPALIGSFVGAVLIQIGKATFGLYLSKAFGVSALYGSLGLIPLFMFWVYMMWLVILFGAEVAALLQAFRGRARMEDAPAHPDGASTLRALEHVAERFGDGRTSTIAEVATVSRLPLSQASLIVDILEDAGLVRRLDERVDEEPSDAITMARPADAIRVADVLRATWTALDRTDPPTPLETKLRDAQLSALGESSLAASMQPIASA